MGLLQLPLIGSGDYLVIERVLRRRKPELRPRDCRVDAVGATKFTPDAMQISRGVVVNKNGWQSNLRRQQVVICASLCAAQPVASLVNFA
jgi:hypothetical protein